MKKTIYFILIVIILIILFIMFTRERSQSLSLINSTSSTSIIINTDSNTASSSILTYKNVLKIYNLKSGDTIKSPFELKGEARTWYFEGSFPVKVVDSAGNVLVAVPAEAQADWMSNDFVPFKAKLVFNVSATATNGYVILEKDNPSDLRQFDDSFKIPVKFQK